MASPFPGMDPFLEDPAFWPDFHFTFINYWREAIADVLPENYEATIGERVYLIENDPDLRKLSSPDIAVIEGQRTARSAYQATGVATLEPVNVPLVVLDGYRESYIDILHQPG